MSIIGIKLTRLSDDEKLEVEFKSGSILVGRNAEVCTLVLTDKHVARLHARFDYDENGILFLYDIERKNGTYINGKKMEQEDPVVISIGDTITFAGIDSYTFDGYLEGEAPIDIDEFGATGELTPSEEVPQEEAPVVAFEQPEQAPQQDAFQPPFEPQAPQQDAFQPPFEPQAPQQDAFQPPFEPQAPQGAYQPPFEPQVPQGAYQPPFEPQAPQGAYQPPFEPQAPVQPQPPFEPQAAPVPDPYQQPQQFAPQQPDPYQSQFIPQQNTDPYQQAPQPQFDPYQAPQSPYIPQQAPVQDAFQPPFNPQPQDQNGYQQQYQQPPYNPNDPWNNNNNQ